MIGNLRQSTFCSWTTLCLVIAAIFNTQLSALASYKVILKDGTVVEAMSKPVSMDDQYIIRTTDNKTYSIHLYQVNLAATEGANQPTPRQDANCSFPGSTNAFSNTSGPG